MAQRTALVTGGSSGIGYAIARTLGEAGFAVTIGARREEKLRNAAEELRGDGLEINDVVYDAASEESVIALVRAHKDRYGGMDVLVNNAGIGIGAAVGDTQTKYLDMQLDVNLRSTVLCTREALPMLRESAKANDTAYIINLASIAGRYGQPWLSVYAATKAAIANWSNGIHKELQNDGIRVTALSPAFVETPMTEFARQGGVEGEKMIRPEDLSSAVLWLLSLSRNVRIPEIVFERVGDELF
ncbi:MAG: SDR family oxidoreductase [Thermoleophilia bacterium]|nr:SDR family oxidoreductase [Thermoleophilia bacterium]